MTSAGPATRIPPHNVEAERAVLGAVLLEGATSLGRVASKLAPSDFYLDANRILYGRLLAMLAGGEPIDLITVNDALRRAEELHQVGGPAALALLAEEASIAAHLDRYVVFVREMAVLRELIQTSTEVIAQAFEAKDDVQLVVDHARAVFEQIAQRAVIAEKPFDALLVRDLLALDVPEPAFLLDRWIPETSLSFVVGDSEAFKSWFTLYLGFCVAAGVPMFGQIGVSRVPVLVISEENGLPEDKRRVSLLARGMGFDVAELRLHIASETSFSFDDPAKYAALRAYVQEHGIRLVIIDSFVRVHRREEKDAGEMNALYLDRIKPLIRDGVAVVALHHKRKLPAGTNVQPSDSDDIRGSGDIRAAAHAVLFLRTVSDTKVVVKHNKARGWKKQEPFVFGLRDVDAGGVELVYEGKPEDVLDKTSACKLAILEYAQQHPVFYREDVIAALKGKFSKKVIDPTLKELASSGYPLKAEHQSSGRVRKKVFQYVADDPGVASEEQTDVPF